jgi:hypothetical protein
MKAVEIEWMWPVGGIAKHHLAHDPRELNNLLKKIHTEAQTKNMSISVSVKTLTGHDYSIVLGLNDESILTYNGLNNNPPFLVSSGTSKDEVMVSYYYMGSYSELPACCKIPIKMAIEALVDSLEIERPSELITWE